MTPKRLGVLIICILAVWSVVGPPGLSLLDDTVGISAVGVATAGDPDQYTNGPSNNPGGSPDSTKTTATPPKDGSSGKLLTPLGTFVSVLSFVLWGSSAAS